MAIDYDAIVIGSGLGGLTAGALYARAGHRVLVLEQNDRFGGAATTYHRGSMTIEASLHETAHPRLLPTPRERSSRHLICIRISSLCRWGTSRRCAVHS